MELKYHETDLVGDYFLINYTKHLKESKEICMICQTDETKDGKQWERYQIVCGHIAHTRCLRRWCTIKGRLNCFCCGDDINRKPRNRYCQECNTFGHAFGDKSCFDKLKLYLPERNNYFINNSSFIWV